MKPLTEQTPKVGLSEKGTWFATHKAARGENGSYLLSFGLEPGRYQITDVQGNATALLIAGHFDFPMDLEFQVEANEVAHVGRVTMVNRDRLKGEPRAGGIFPLIDQGVTGFAAGTFDVGVREASMQEAVEFKTAYPALHGIEVTQRPGTRVQRGTYEGSDGDESP